MEEQQKIKNSLLKSLIDKFKLFFKRAILEKDFFNNKIVLWLLGLNFFTNAVNWIILLIFTNRFDTGIILHYNVYFGVDETGAWQRSFIVPIIGLLLIVLNSILAAYFYRKKERIAVYVLLLASFMAQLSLIISSISIILINY